MSDKAKPYTLKEFDKIASGPALFSDFDAVYPHVLDRLRATVEALERARQELEVAWADCQPTRPGPYGTEYVTTPCGACARCVDEQKARAEKAEAERDELLRLQQVWLASPEAAQRLDGYRQLAAKCATLEAERDEARADAARLREALEGVLDNDCYHPENLPDGDERCQRARAALERKHDQDD